MRSHVVSCVRPTGGLHIGQYFGAVSRLPLLQRSYDCFLGVADLHQLTLPYRQSDQHLWVRTLTAATDLFACGVDPLSSVVFVQSLVPEHAELCWILGCLCSYNDLPKMPLFKQNFERSKMQRSMLVSAGLLNYPLLQAADILIYKAALVPVGADQAAHIELARKLARSFNRVSGVFPIPEPDFGATPKIMALQAPELKMSWNRGEKNVIGLFEDEASVRSKIDKAKTASVPLPNGKFSPGVENLLTIFRACKPLEAEAVADDLSQGRMQFKDFKARVADALVELTGTLREQRSHLVAEEVEDLVLEMSAVARARAAETLREVKQALGLPCKPVRVGNWWRFDTDRAVREDPRKRRLSSFLEADSATNGRSNLSYGSYLSLGQLLTAQVPSSKVPDERVFIITHQAIELIFKQMIFDIAVVVRTFQQLLLARSFLALCQSAQPDDPFWRPALTASGRLEHSAAVLLPALMGYLKEDSLFSGIEFFYFRDNLSPASGFQSAQFRLLQRAFGKGPVLDVRLFPSDVYRHSYGQPGPSSVKVVDPVVLRDDTLLASPENGPLAEVAKLDDVAHELLGRLAQFAEEAGDGDSVPTIAPADVEKAVTGYQETLKRTRSAQQERGQQPSPADLAQDSAAIDTLRADLEGLKTRENARRSGLADARKGALAVQQLWGLESHLKSVLDRLVAVDEALHGPDPRSFLGTHYELAKHRVTQVQQHAATLHLPTPPGGTGGGGIEYLAYSRKLLLELFPAIVAYSVVRKRFDVAQSRAVDFD